MEKRGGMRLYGLFRGTLEGRLSSEDSSAPPRLSLVREASLLIKASTGTATVIGSVVAGELEEHGISRKLEEEEALGFGGGGGGGGMRSGLREEDGIGAGTFVEEEEEGSGVDKAAFVVVVGAAEVVGTGEEEEEVDGRRRAGGGGAEDGAGVGVGGAAVEVPGWELDGISWPKS